MTKDISVEEFTSPSVLTVGLNTSAENAKKIMLENKIRHLPVLDGDKICGLVSERDLYVLESSGREHDSISVKDFMKENVYVTEPSTPLYEVAFEMSQNKIGSAVIYSKKEEFLGIFTSTDALNALLEILRGDV